MYKIPDNIDISILNDKKINQISFGLNFFTLHFDLGFIQCTGAFLIDHKGIENMYEEVYPVTNDFGLLRILETNLIHVSLNELRTKLFLKFEDGTLLSLIGNESYESFQIKISDLEIRV